MAMMMIRRLHRSDALAAWAGRPQKLKIYIHIYGILAEFPRNFIFKKSTAAGQWPSQGVC
eukprot:1855289-Karenia_brevis.AAC.1